MRYLYSAAITCEETGENVAMVSSYSEEGLEEASEALGKIASARWNHGGWSLKNCLDDYRRRMARQAQERQSERDSHAPEPELVDVQFVEGVGIVNKIN